MFVNWVRTRKVVLLTKIIKFLETPDFVYFSMGIKVEYLGFALSVSSGGLEGYLSSQQVGRMPQILTHWPEITDDGCTRVLHSPTWFGSYVAFDLIASILDLFYSVSAPPALFARTQLVCVWWHRVGCAFCLHHSSPRSLADSASFRAAQELRLPRSLSSSFIERFKYKKRK